jgi:HTH-type transcriptional regulator/antitoxin HigA
MQSVKPLANEAEYDLALKGIDRYLGALVGSPEYLQLETLTILVEEYEAKHWPISPPDLNPNLEEWCRLDAGLVERLQSLVAGVQVDLDEILSPDETD